MSSAVTAHVSLPCSMAVRTHASYSLLFTLSESPFVASRGKSSLNFAQAILILAATLSAHPPPLLTWSPR
uniref:Uncharacterized protein n=1 Tax=Octopus bimaculoides TaxID=37653 RepID=A0A0L8I8A0_OCTBM